MKKLKPAFSLYPPVAEYSNADSEAQKQVDAFIEEVGKRIPDTSPDSLRFTQGISKLYLERCAKALPAFAVDFKAGTTWNIVEQLVYREKANASGRLKSLRLYQEETLLLARALSKTCSTSSDEFLSVAQKLSYICNMADTFEKCSNLVKGAKGNSCHSKESKDKQDFKP